MQLGARAMLSLLGWLATAIAPVAAQQRTWGVGLEVGLTRFWGGSEPIAPNNPPGFRPYRPTTFGLRLDHAIGRARVGVGALYAASGLGTEDDQLTIVAKGGLKWVQLTPELAYWLGTIGPVAEIRLFAGPVFDFWLPTDEDARTRIGGRGGLELLVPLGSGLAGTLRAHGGVSGSLFRDTDVPSDFRTKSMPNVGVALGLQLGL